MFKSIVRNIKWVGGYRARLNIGYVFSFFHAIFTAMPIALASFALNMIIEDYRGLEPMDSSWIWKMAGLIIFAVLGRFIFSYFRAIFQDSIAFERTAFERMEVGQILKRVSLGFFSKNKTGEISTAVTTDLSYFETFAMKMLDTVVSGYISAGVMIVFMLFFSPIIGVVAIVGILLSALALHKLGTSSRKNTIVHQKVQDEMVSAVLEYIRGIAIIKAFGKTEQMEKGVDSTFEGHKKINIKIEKYFAIFNGLHLLVLRLASVAIMLVATILTLNGYMSLPVLIMMCLFSFVIFANVEVINNATHVLKILDGVLDKMDAIKKAKFIDEDGKSIKLNKYDIEFKNVSFAYDEKPTIKNLSFKVPEGSTTAIVGPSGSGKTTLVRLIARFYDVDAGSITVGGEPVKDMKGDSLLENISMVFQQVYLFNDTIRNNIRFGKMDASDSQVEEAAKSACCHEFIMSLPDGYETVIGDGGATLSGGEKQRVSIARAILKDSPIIILDEATASVDPENEHLIQQAINSLVSGKTIIIIAHRLKTIQTAEQILVLKDGELAQCGTHSQLIKEDNVYKWFWDIRKKAESWEI